MSLYNAEVGIWVIRPEYREDFYILFSEEYSLEQKERLITAKPIKEYLELMIELNVYEPICYWKHNDNKTEWAGKYKTSYDKTTGVFQFGKEYNVAGMQWCQVRSLITDCLWEIAETIEWDQWEEPT